jgi:trans-AT polyketide synthase, acyltransferase and oxidoreductase domains
MTAAWVFPGQGAQRRGMGADVVDRYPDLCAQAGEILGYDVRAQCLDGAAPGLHDTRYVQPALFVVNALSFLARMEGYPPPDFVAGHSLGEYNALFAAGCFDFATGVRLVQRRGELMGRATGGGMVAVVGAPPDRIAALLRESGIGDVDLANRNSAEQVVLSGPDDALRRASAAVTAAGLGRCVPLRVSAPFHSRQMAAAAAEFRSYLDGVRFAEPRIPVIANVTARPYPAGAVPDLLARQVDGPVCWWESMSYLLARGVDDLVEVGPGRVLTDLWAAARERPCPVAPPREPVTAQQIRAERLGSAQFRRDYGVRYAYLAGSMFKAVASIAMVVRLARAGLMGFFGAGGLTLDEIDAALCEIRGELGDAGRFGMNLLATPDDPAAEREIVTRYLRHDVRYLEAASYVQVTAGVVHFRFQGAYRAPDGTPRARRHIVAKVSRPEVATAFLSPPPGALLDRLVVEGALTADEAAIAASLPVAGDVCVEADSGGHTDAGSPYALMPAMVRLRDDMQARYRYPVRVRIGAAGGIGSPESVAAAFVLGADFVVTGSVNQCTPEAGTSDAVKDLLAAVDVQDTAYAPAGDLFELGARAQVVRKGTLFAARANKLYQVYRQFGGLDEIDPDTRRTIEERYFRRSFGEVWDETREYLRKNRSRDIERAENNPKVKMALVFRWYFVHSTRLAMAGVPGEQVNYQVHCGPSLGAFNRLVAGTPMEPWRARHVDRIAELLMTGAAELLDGSLRAWSDAEG